MADSWGALVELNIDAGSKTVVEFGLFNVLRHGLKRDNFTALAGTDNTGALNELLDFIANDWMLQYNVGAAVLFPPGGYGFKGSIVPPIGTARAIRAIGAGRGGTRVQNNQRPQRITRLRRIAGADPLIRVPQATSATDFVSFELRDLALDGGKDFGLVECGALLQTSGAPELRVRDVKFISNDGIGAIANGANNGDMSGCRFHNCGSAWLDPSLAGLPSVDRTPALIASGSDPFIGVTNTLRLTDMEFEANLGADFICNANKVIGENWKLEGFGDGGAYPYMHLIDDTEGQYTNIAIVPHRPSPAIVKEGPNAVDVGNAPAAVTKIAASIHQQIGTSPYYIDQLGGGLLCELELSAQPGSLPTTAYWHIGPDVLDRAAHLGSSSWDDDVALFNDER